MLLPLLLLLSSSSGAQPPLESRFGCDTCRLFVDEVNEVVNSPTFIEGGEDILTLLCEILQTHTICRGLLDLYSEPFLDGISGKFLNSSYVCSHIGACDDPQFIDENFQEFTSKILSDMPAREPWPLPSGESYYILHVTDMHIDFFYKENSDAKCDSPLCCREGSGDAGKFGSFAKCDAPPSTVTLFLDQIADMDIKFVVWTGDNPPHDIWAYEREKEMDVTRKLVEMFKEKLSVPVYPVIGNHDCFPMDMFNPDHEDVLLKELSDLWSHWLSPESIVDFSKNGYYSQVDETTGLRIIGMNNQLGDNFNFHLIANSTDPGQMLSWMRGILYIAEENNEKVIILGHIPHGDHFADSEWAKHYRVIVNRFQNIIVGQFFGHTHYDEFNLVKSVVPGSEHAGVLHVAPSFTTYSFHNPSFRLYEYDKQTQHLVNIHQYRLPLHKDAAEFEKVFDYKSLYQMNDMSPEAFAVIVDQVKEDPVFAQKFYANFNGRYDFQAGECDERCRTMIYCRMQSDVFDENYKCDQKHTNEERMLKIFEMLIGKHWEYRN